MARLLVVVALVATTLSGCSGEESSDTSSEETTEKVTEEPYDADTATGQEKWAQFVELADDAGLMKTSYPSTFADAGVTAQMLCDRNVAKAAEHWSFERSLYPKAQHQANKTGTMLFLTAYCPEKVGTFEKAWTAPIRPKPKDFQIKINIRSQQCFGSAGCIVEYQINPVYNGLLQPRGNWDITYEVVGDESGPIINTFSLRGNRMSFPAEEMASTPSSSTVLAGKVLRVDKGF